MIVGATEVSRDHGSRRDDRNNPRDRPGGNRATPIRGSDSMKSRGGTSSSSRYHWSRDRSGGNDRSDSHNIRDRSRDKERSLSSRSSPPPPPTRKR